MNRAEPSGGPGDLGSEAGAYRQSGTNLKKIAFQGLLRLQSHLAMVENVFWELSN